MQWPTAERFAPERVGSYSLVRRIGIGGMAEVWLGRHVLSDTLGAVKRLSPKVVRKKSISRYFQREGRAIARLTHPNIVPLFEYGEGFVVTQFIDGMNLARRMQSPIDPQTAVSITRQIAAALAHAHRHGVVHRDVKPENILLDGAGVAYLGDFGVAVLSDEHAREIVGTPQFMAPEQRIGREVGPAADQYALGRTLLEMLAGARVPVERELALEALPEHLPFALRQLLDRATAADPAARFPSVTEMDAALGAIDLTDYHPEVTHGAERRPPWSYRWLAGAHREEKPDGTISRAEYRLRELVSLGVVDASAAEALLERSGLSDIGFSVWGDPTRLGPISHPMALARATEVVVLLHGLHCNRNVWKLISPVLCRGNSLRIVIAPDVHGFGESRFAAPPRPEQGSLQALAQTALELTRVLGLRDLPLALVGHSMSGIALLSLLESDFDPNIVRVAVNPVLVSHDPRILPKIRRFALLTRALSGTPKLFRFVGRLAFRFDETARTLAPEATSDLLAENQTIEPAVLASIVSAIAGAPLAIGRQERVALIACVDDPWMRDEEALMAAATDIGLERAQIHRMASGAHFPFLESATHPEWTARNIDQLVRVIESMLVTANASTGGSEKRSGGTSATDTAPSP